MKTIEVSVKDQNDNDVSIEYDLPENLDEALDYYGEEAEQKILTQLERMNTTDVRNGARSKLKAGGTVEDVQALYKSFKPGGVIGRVRGDATKMLLGRAAKMSAEDLQKLLAELQKLQPAAAVAD